ncbi:effector protein [Candidatus Phytoplasma phoenicium]|uniref:Effector protein n=1 Tax=Candidatus Phytoplasma phoenicium TaxID=198422 RepID=A0A2S8NU52_9MOLU|nr:effector protein [Candidatus Phytoplasma phoenicium]
MFKLQNQFKIISICLFILLGLFINNNKNLYAYPGIDLEVRQHQLEEEINSLMLELTNVFSDTNLESQTRFHRIVVISNILNIVRNELEIINQKIIERNQYTIYKDKITKINKTNNRKS